MEILTKEFQKLTVLNTETGKEIAVVTNEEITTAEKTIAVKLTPAEDAKLARATYERMLAYAIEGCRHLLWKTAFELNKPEVTAAQAQEIVFQLGQMANDLDSYEAEAERLELGK